MKMIKEVIIILLLTLVPKVDLQTQGCHKECSYDKTIGLVNCTAAGCTTIPRLPDYTTSLIFSGNCLNNITENTFDFNNLYHLKYLKLDSCNISFISPGVFAGLQSLQTLDLTENRLTKITLSPDLSVVDFNHKSLPSNISFCPPNLKKLYLSHNRIRYIQSDTLSRGCRNLEELYLNGNYFDFFNFSNVPSGLKMLNMSKTKLCRGIPSLCGNGDGFRYLEHLDLSFNAFYDLTVFTTEGNCLPRLQSLNLSGNGFVDVVPSYLISKLQSIQIVSLKYMDSYVTLDKNVFNSSSLRHLSLQTMTRVRLQRSETILQFFKQCPNLRGLELQNLNLELFNETDLDEMFSHLPHLEELRIEDGYLSHLGFLKNLHNLTKLYLHRNQIRNDWNSEVFNHLRLTHLDMGRNEIASIDMATFPTRLWDTIEKLDLHGNPFDCSKHLCEFRKWISNNENKLNNYPKKYFCDSPSDKKGTLLRSWKPTEEECNPKEPKPTKTVFIEVGCILGGIVLVCCVIGGIIYRIRWKIKHYIYLYRSRKQYQTLPDGDCFVYDAFVAYHFKDRAWIVTHLLPFLESEKKLRLCLHERDFLPGNFIADNIIYNLESSRKVILVLSNNFAKSEWCQFEATTAYRRVESDDVSAVVLVMLEEIHSRNMNQILGNLLQTMTYIEWTYDKAGRELFWRRLDDSLK